MKTLVTGATGFVGSHVAGRVLSAGQSLRVLTRRGSDVRTLRGLEAERVEGDLRDAASLERALIGVNRVFHVAADYRLWSRNPAEIYESNVTGTRNLLEAAKRAGVEQFIYTSTVATIAVDRPALPNEATDSKLDEMVGHYKRSKWLAEKEALKAAQDGMPVIIVMPTTPVGPGDWKPTPTGKLIVDFLNGKMPGYVETGLNFAGVEDVAAGHMLASDRGKSGERYLLGAENLSLKQVLDILAQLSGLPASAIENPTRHRIGVCLHGECFLANAGPRAADSGRRREDRPPQHVRGCFESAARVGICAGAGGRGARARRAVV